MKIIENLEQGTAEWHQARRGKVTGTKLKRVMGTQWDRVMLTAELIAEEGTEQSKIIRANTEMERGTAEEPFAIKAFEFKTGKDVEVVGACVSDEHDWLLLSPDGLIKNNGKYTEAVEVKSPDSKMAIFYKMANMIKEEELAITPAKKPIKGIPHDYIWQVVHYFIVNEELKKLHFVTYDERFVENEAKMYIVEVTRKDLEEEITEAKARLSTFRDDWLRWKEIVLPDNF